MALYRTGWPGGGTQGTGSRTVTFTPSIGDYLIVVVAVSGWDGTENYSVTDDRGGTYALVSVAFKAANADKLFVYVRRERVTSSAAHILTSAGYNSAEFIGIFAYIDVHNDGVAGFTQSAVASNQAAGGIPTVSLSVPSSGHSPLIAVLFNSSAAGSVGVPPTGFAERLDNAQNNPTTALEVATVDRGVATSSVQWAAASTTAYCAIVVELAVQIYVPAGVVNVTGYAPTPVVADNRNVSVPLGAVTLTGYAPVVHSAAPIDIPCGAITVEGYAPTVTATQNSNIAIPRGTINVTGYAPQTLVAAPGVGKGVYESIRNGTAGVFDWINFISGATFQVEVPIIAQTPETDVVPARVQPVIIPTIAERVVTADVQRATAHTVATISTIPVIAEIWVGLTYPDIGEFLGDTRHTLAVQRSETVAEPTIAADPELTVTYTVIPGTSHSTFYWQSDPPLSVAPVLAPLQFGTQMQVGLTQRPELLPVEIIVDVAGIQNHYLEFLVGEASSLLVDAEEQPLNRPGARPSAGWLLEPRRQTKAERRRNEAVARERRRREQIAAEAAAQAAAAEAARKATEERMAALRAEMERQAVADAPFRVAYEQQLQGMAQQMSAQGQAAMAEIMRLRSELAQTQAQLQQNEKQDNEDEAIALLLLKQ